MTVIWTFSEMVAMLAEGILLLLLLLSYTSYRVLFSMHQMTTLAEDRNHSFRNPMQYDTPAISIVGSRQSSDEYVLHNRSLEFRLPHHICVLVSMS